MKPNYTIRLRLLFIVVCIIFPGALRAQLSMNGEFRPRTEFRNGYRLLHTSDSDPAFFTSQRTRLNLLFDDEDYQFKIAAQDVKVWGDEAQLKDNPNVNIHEAWAELKANDRFRIKIGRQELVYDDQRLLGSVNWSQIARSHDAILLKYKNGLSDLSLDLGMAYNQENEAILGNSYSLDNYKLLSYLWMRKKLEGLDFSGILLMDGFETTSGAMNYRYTYGTFVNYEFNDLLASGTVYFQKGDDKGRTNISAYMIAGKLSYTLRALKVAAGFDYLSGGDKNDAEPSQYAFSTLYATNHKFYGNMDYFLDIPNETRGGGLQDIYLNAEYASSKQVTLSASYHIFSLAHETRDPVNNSELLKKNLGSEVDISATYRISGDTRLLVGYSTIFNTDSLERIQQRAASGIQQWGWVMLVLTPEFLSAE